MAVVHGAAVAALAVVRAVMEDRAVAKVAARATRGTCHQAVVVGASPGVPVVIRRSTNFRSNFAIVLAEAFPVARPTRG